MIRVSTCDYRERCERVFEVGKVNKRRSEKGRERARERERIIMMKEMKYAYII